MFGPYFKCKKENKWHWKKTCPDFPKDSVNSMVSSSRPKSDILCEKCAETEEKERNDNKPGRTNG